MSIGPYVLRHCYEVLLFTDDMFHAEHALQLMEAEPYCRPSNEASDGRRGQEIHHYPQPARRSLILGPSTIIKDHENEERVV